MLQFGLELGDCLYLRGTWKVSSFSSHKHEHEVQFSLFSSATHGHTPRYINLMNQSLKLPRRHNVWGAKFNHGHKLQRYNADSI